MTGDTDIHWLEAKDAIILTIAKMLSSELNTFKCSSYIQVSKELCLYLYELNSNSFLLFIFD